MKQERATSHEVSGDKFVAAQTNRLEKEFKCSRPKPRNRAMGFNGSDKPKRERPFSW